MLNLEKYLDEIVNITSGCSGIVIVHNKPVSCANTPCNKCDCDNTNMTCIEYVGQWARSEYKEQFKLTQKERKFCELFETGWITRDYDNELWWYKGKPTKRDMIWGNTTGDEYIRLSTLSKFGINFEFITWSDEEPWAVEDLLKLEVEE